MSQTLTTNADELRRLGEAHFWPHFHMAGDMNPLTGTNLAVRGRGIWVEDADGEQWLDGVGSMWLMTIGHGRKEIADAVYEQMQQISYAPGGMVSESSVRLSAKVAALAPDKQSRVFFVSGGSEAVETAMKIAKAYHHRNGQPGRYKMISRRNSYHGGTLACLGLGMCDVHRPHQYGPLMPGNVYVSQPDNYRGPVTADDCARELERVIEHEGPHTIAAFIGEPISLPGGLTIPQPDYWPRIREVCDRYDILLILDEVVCGFGRLGRWFGSEHWNVQPDITTVAKALSSGYMPLGAAIVRKKVADAFLSKDTMLNHVFTYGGNPVACAAALKNIEIMENENVVDQAAATGEYLLEQMGRLLKHPIVGDVRGRGMLAGFEIVKDKATKQPFDKAADLGGRFERLFIKYRMFARGGSLVLVCPPLVTTRDEVDELVDRFDRLLVDLQNEL